MKVALVGCTHPPQVDFDEPPLLAALAARGHAARPAAWDDPAVDWASYDAVLLRSTWDYYHRRDAFLDWAARVEAASTLWNPLPIVRWNTHKSYLRDLENHGADVVPTIFLSAGTRVDLAALLDERAWDAAVLKPVVGADSFATVRAERSAPVLGQAHLDRHLPERDMLVQLYLPAVVDPGERCLVFIDGAYSHAVRKRSAFLGGRHAGPEGVPVQAAADEVAAARRILDCAPYGTSLYARVDLLRDEHGTPRLVELEMVEPSLFFAEGPSSAVRLVAALEARMRALHG